jgi:hypothetical protein
MGKFFKFISIPLIILMFILGYLDYKQETQTTPQQQVTNDTKDLQNQIKDLENTVNTYKLKAQEDKLRKIRLQQLQSPEIIVSELQKTNELIVYTGVFTYNDYIKEGSWFANKSLDITLTYNFGIVIDMNTVTVSGFADEIPILMIPKDEVKLKYVELDTANSKIDGKKSFFSKQFLPEDIKGLAELAQESVTDKINNDKEIFDSAFFTLKENLKDLILKLGYSDVIFVEE